MALDHGFVFQLFWCELQHIGLHSYCSGLHQDSLANTQDRRGREAVGIWPNSGVDQAVRCGSALKWSVCTRLGQQILEELLVIDAGHAADLWHFDLGCCVSVDEVGGDADSQLSSQLFALKTYKFEKKKKRKECYKRKTVIMNNQKKKSTCLFMQALSTLMCSLANKGKWLSLRPYKCLSHHWGQTCPPQQK